MVGSMFVMDPTLRGGRRTDIGKIAYRGWRRLPGMKKLLLGCALAFVISCSSKSDEEKMMEKSVSMMEEIAKVVESSGDDCGKMASGIEGVYKKYEGDIKAMQAMKEKVDSDPKKQEEMKRVAMKYASRLEKVMPAMLGMMKCADDPKMKEMSEKMEGLM